ncbi:MAG: EI24 domain-containing protein [Planctomycetes bacterium]|jgi:CysZ protein|nr:EI24 domain-containing protein [Planctomycetota bacterium]MCL4730782.1 EI24 domain-containing protein [Planctomycetota bacterium]
MKLPVATPLPSGLRGFVAGFAAFLVGLRLVLPGGGLFRWALAPVLASALVLGGLAAGAFLGVWAWLDGMLQDWRWLAWLGGLAALIVTLLLAYFLFTPVMGLFGPLFMDPICEQVHIRYAGGPIADAAQAPSFARRQLRAVVVSLKWLVISLAVQLPLAVVGLITVAGLVIAVPVNALLQGVDLMDNPLGLRNWPLGRRLGWCRRHTMATLGIGAAASLCLLVPGLNLFMLPAGVAGATVLMVAAGPAQTNSGEQS